MVTRAPVPPAELIAASIELAHLRALVARLTRERDALTDLLVAEYRRHRPPNEDDG